MRTYVHTYLWQLGAQTLIACCVFSWRAQNCLRMCICMVFGNNVCLYALCVFFALFYTNDALTWISTHSCIVWALIYGDIPRFVRAISAPLADWPSRPL